MKYNYVIFFTAWGIYTLVILFGLAIVMELNMFEYNTHSTVMGVFMIVINGCVMGTFRTMRDVKTVIVKAVHGIGHTIVLAGSLYGVIVMLLHNWDQEGYVRGFHAYMGYAIVTFYAVHWLFALHVYAYRSEKQRKRKLFASWHNFMGLVTVQASICIACYQIQDVTYGHFNVHGSVLQLIFITFGVILNVLLLNPYLEWDLVGEI